jgi:hypothetical protein
VSDFTFKFMGGTATRCSTHVVHTCVNDQLAVSYLKSYDTIKSTACSCHGMHKVTTRPLGSGAASTLLGDYIYSLK